MSTGAAGAAQDGRRARKPLNNLHFLTAPLRLALMELLSAESWSVFLLALVPVMALATLAGIALAVIFEDLGRRRA